MRSSDSLGFRANLPKAEFAGRLARKNRAKKALTGGDKSFIIGMSLPVSAVEKEIHAPGLQPINTPHGDGNSRCSCSAIRGAFWVATDQYPSRGWKQASQSPPRHCQTPMLQPINTPHGDGNH